MSDETKCIVNAMIMGVILNLVLPFVVTPFATKEEIKPPQGAAALSYKGQFVHMLVHHNQVPVMSSLIVAVIVGVAVYLGYKYKPYQKLFRKGMAPFKSVLELP
tara:strand:- start:613 stop:924 length:312 start_codon:yes stop_codon:yes gene_type:complete